MQNTTSLYQSIVDGNHWFETKVVVNNNVTYTEDKLFSVRTSLEMFSGTPEVGKAVASEIEVKMLNVTDDIPRMAVVRPYVRAKNGTQTSEWLPQGVFYIDTRERTKNDDGLDILTLHGFDAMLKAEEDFVSPYIHGDSVDTAMVAEIARLMGVSVDARTYDLMTDAYTIPLPVGYTCREVLGYIASAYAGCFIMSDEGKLRLVSINEMPPETNLLIEEGGDAIVFGVEQSGEEVSLSGSTVSFTANVDEITAFEANIESVQSGSGTPSSDNVRPISGFSGITIYHSGSDTSNPNTQYVSFGSAGTVYGGTIDVMAGTLTVTKVLVQDALASVATRYSNANGYFWYTTLSACSAPTIKSFNAGLKCNRLSAVNYVIAGSPEGDITVYDSGIIRWTEQKDLSQAEYRAYLATNPLQIEYELAEAITYQLTPEQIEFFSGENNYWADTGDISLTYRTLPSEPVRILV